MFICYRVIRINLCTYNLDEGLKARISGVTFGMVTISGVTVRERDERLWRQIEALCLATREGVRA